jgi:hypothetical protein
MSKISIIAVVLFAVTCIVAQDTPQPAMKSPAEGYNVHVLAPHVVDGHAMGPYHHYCKTVSPEPQIVCLIYESTEPNAMLVQVEYIFAKSLTRKNVSLRDWNKNWHDHKQEISTGRVQVLDLPPDKAKEVADLVATTDGIIYHIYFSDKIPKLPLGRTSIAQSVGHVNIKSLSEGAEDVTKPMSTSTKKKMPDKEGVKKD